MIDLLLYEGGSGGDMQLLPNDLATTDAMWNNIYLALFGGNVESTHEDKEEDSTEFNTDYWQNKTFYSEQEDKQLNSLTESTITETVISSAGLNNLEQVIKTDLNYLKQIGSLDVEVSQEGVDRIKIDITIDQTVSSYIWDATKQELITNQLIGAVNFTPPFEGVNNSTLTTPLTLVLS